MKKNNSEKENNKPGTAKFVMKGVGEYMRHNYPFLILFFAGLLAVSALNFVKISTAEQSQTFLSRILKLVRLQTVQLLQTEAFLQIILILFL